jgi:hypothetical protein
MTNPAEFLATRLDEESAVAEEIKAASKREGGWIYSIDIRTVEGDTTTTIRKVKVYNPDEVLSLVAAHRRIAELHTGSHECACYSKRDGVMDYDEIDNCVWVAEYNEPCSTLELLAQAYGWTEETT